MPGIRLLASASHSFSSSITFPFHCFAATTGPLLFACCRLPQVSPSSPASEEIFSIPAAFSSSFGFYTPLSVKFHPVKLFNHIQVSDQLPPLPPSLFLQLGQVSRPLPISASLVIDSQVSLQVRLLHLAFRSFSTLPGFSLDIAIQYFNQPPDLAFWTFTCGSYPSSHIFSYVLRHQPFGFLALPGFT
jgi:hypothetical protein